MIYKLLISCILISVYSTKVLSFTDIEYVNTNCGSTVFVTSATRLKLESYMVSELENPCEITLTADDSFHSDLSLQGSFINFNLPCNYGSVTIYDSTDPETRTVLASDICGYKPSTLYKSVGDSLVVEINRYTGYTYYSGSFDFLFTESHDGYCDNTEFQCDNYQCIDDFLTCDGYNNCGDNSDEGGVCFWSIGTITGIAMGCGFFILFVVIIIAVACRRKRRVIYQNQCGTMPYTNGPQVVAQPYFYMPQPQYGATPPPGYQQTAAPIVYQQDQPKTAI